MKLNPVEWHSGGVYGYAFFCPGCEAIHQIRTDPDTAARKSGNNAVWTFNGNLEQPTFTPSLLVHEVNKPAFDYHKPRCHTIITDGKIRFLDDCQHKLANQTVEIPEWKGWKEEDYK